MEIPNSDGFAERAGVDWANKPIEAFKCSECQAIMVGAPDCHVAFPDPRNLNKRVPYNRREVFHCPLCNAIFPLAFLASSHKEKHEVSAQDLLSSDWQWLVA